MNTTAIYFDGKSSIPQEIQLTLDKTSGVLSFSTPYFKKKINLSDVKTEKIGKFLLVLFEEDSIQQIKIEDLKFQKELSNYLKTNNNWYDKIVSLNIGTHVVLSIVFLAFIGIIYFYGVPYIAEKTVDIIPEEYDNQLSTLFFEEFIESEIVNKEKTKLLNDFSKELQLNNTKPLKFTVIESDMVNAFALPDGNIVVFTGIIDAVENANELSGLIGHEAAHVNKRHSMKMLCRNLSGYLFISAVFNDVNGITAIIGDNIHSLQSMSYSRTFEKEADIEALEILQQNNIDPKGMLLLFDRLESHSVIEIPEFLSSHPITKERSNYIKELITKKKIKIVSNKKTEDLFKKLKKAL
mgnify:CR=1 FL=1|jgi:Zn-dependent protease with chaperone function